MIKCTSLSYKEFLTILCFFIFIAGCKSESETVYFEKELEGNFIIPDRELRINDRYTNGLKLDSTYLLVFFNPDGCIYTIEHEIILLNNFYMQHSEKMHIVIFGRSDTILKRGYGANFNAVNFEENPIILNKKIKILDPVRVIVGKKNKVELISFSDRNNRTVNNNFYETITKYFN